MERETRFIKSGEVRAAEDSPSGIVGTAALYNETTNIGGMFEERIQPGAFDAVLDSDVVGLYNHDSNYVLGRTPTTLALSTDNVGLRYSIPELPQSRADVLEAVRRGDVKGNSFSFAVGPDGEEWEDRSGDGMIPLRTITRVAKLFDVGPVTFPAYEATTVVARSAEERAQEFKVPCPDCKAKDSRIVRLEADLRTANMFRQPRR